jgi:hypothetical protein
LQLAHVATYLLQSSQSAVVPASRAVFAILQICALRSWLQAGKHPGDLSLTYRDREGYKATVYPRSCSVLDELRLRCNRLARLYSWEVEDMAWVFLTGVAPRLPALKMQVNYTQSGPRITLTTVRLMLDATLEN